MTAVPAFDPRRSPGTRPPTARPRDTRPVKPSPAPPQLRLVPAPKRRHAYMAYLAVCAAILVGAMAAVLSLNTSLTKGAFELRELETQLADLEAERSQLAEQLSAKAAPGVLADAARQLGMMAAPSTAYIVLGTGGLVGAVPTPAGQDPAGEDQATQDQATQDQADQDQGGH